MNSGQMPYTAKRTAHVRELVGWSLSVFIGSNEQKGVSVRHSIVWHTKRGDNSCDTGELLLGGTQSQNDDNK